MLVHASWTWVRYVVAAVIVTGFLTITLLLSGMVSTWPHSAVDKQQSGWQPSHPFGHEACDCVWRIGCVRYRWQVNFTSPQYRCSHQEMTDGLLTECLTARYRARRRPLRLHIVGHVREAFLVDYVRQRLGATPVLETCRLTQTGPSAKLFDTEQELQNTAQPIDGSETCEMVYETEHVLLEFKLLGFLGDDVFHYVDRLRRQCQTEGCHGDVLIISGGVSELLNSTLMDSFSGVKRFQRRFQSLLPVQWCHTDVALPGLRRFQRRFQSLLPQLIDLATSHQLHVVWKVHEPVTDEMMQTGSMIRNDLLQEYNALVMEQTMRTPVRVWTSHMIIKLHHIEACAAHEDDQVNAPPWRCEDEWVAGDKCHREYFDTIFNRVCDKLVSMPENPCCSS